MRHSAAWLLMSETVGDYPVPSSEAAFKANCHLLDVALPMNGGTVQSNGTWKQSASLVEGDWPQSLPALAAAAGQLYMPTVSCNRDQIVALLENGAAQRVAAEGLVDLALGRFDAIWDGVCVNIEGVPSAYKNQLSAFLTLLSTHIREAGLLFCIAVRGILADSGLDYDDAYSHDYAVVADVADQVFMFTYNYWQPEPRSMCPLWWVRGCIEYALSKGISAPKLHLGLANYASYWPISSLVTRHEMIYSQARQVIDDGGAIAEWIESNVNGDCCEWYADVPPSHFWFQDGDTIQPRLALVDEFDLAGPALFALGMGAESVWQAIADWKDGVDQGSTLSMSLRYRRQS